MTTSIDNIASQITTLKEADLIKLKQLTEMLLGGTEQATAIQYSSDDERILFQAIQSELEAAGFRSRVQYSGITSGKYSKCWKKSVNTVTEFLDDAFSDYSKSEAQRLGLCRIFVQALIKEFKQRGIPVSAGTIVSNLHRVQQVFDRAFPSYLESGLAYLIPQAMLRPRNHA